MAGVNKVILVGNLGDDPESRSLNNGGEVVNLRVATSENWKDKDGNRQERTEWHRVVIFNENLGRVAKSYLRKGSKVYLEGQIQTRKWTDQSGADRYSTEVVLQRFRGELVLLDSRGSGGGGGGRISAAAIMTAAAPASAAAAVAADRVPSPARRPPSTAISTTTFRSDGPGRPSPRRKPGSMLFTYLFKAAWMPAFAGMTATSACPSALPAPRTGSIRSAPPPRSSPPPP